MAVDAFIWFRPSSALTGFAGGKNIHVMVRPGTTPPPGNYDIHPPVQDPIHGLIALMVPTGGSGAPKQEKWQPAAYSYVNAPAGKIAPPAGKIAPPAGKIAPPAMWLAKSISPKIAAESTSQGPQVFVISHNPIPGRNAVVISSGFADLMDALQAGGGATIQVI